MYSHLIEMYGNNNKGGKCNEGKTVTLTAHTNCSLIEMYGNKD